jgi:hypothetical protein
LILRLWKNGFPLIENSLDGQCGSTYAQHNATQSRAN